MALKVSSAPLSASLADNCPLRMASSSILTAPGWAMGASFVPVMVSVSVLWPTAPCSSAT